MDGWFALRQCFGRFEINPSNEVVLVFIDENDTDHTVFTNLLMKAADDDAKAVVFDIVFDSKLWSRADVISDLTLAVSNSIQNADLKVIFAAEGYEEEGIKKERLPSEGIRNLVKQFAPSTAIGVNTLERFAGAVRRHSSDEGHFDEPLAVAAAKRAEPKTNYYSTKWINFYGPPGAFPHFDLTTVLTNDLERSLYEKVVFVGQGLDSSKQRLAPDSHQTPLTRFPFTFSSSIAASSGVEIHATAYSNLVHQDWLNEPGILDLFGFAVLSVLFGCGFTRWSPVRAAWVVVIGSAATIILLIMLVSKDPTSISWCLILSVPQLIAGFCISWIPLKEAFFSYRRSDGEGAVRIIVEGLRRKGIEVFVDYTAMGGGRLKQILYPAIAERRNFILALTEKLVTDWGAKPTDWVHAEITEALRLQRIAEALNYERIVLPIRVGHVGVFLKGKPLPDALKSALGNVPEEFHFSTSDACISNIAKKLKWGVRGFSDPEHSPRKHLKFRRMTTRMTAPNGSGVTDENRLVP